MKRKEINWKESKDKNKDRIGLCNSILRGSSSNKLMKIFLPALILMLNIASALDFFKNLIINSKRFTARALTTASSVIKIVMPIALIIALITLAAIPITYAAGTVSHPASHVTAGTFDTGNFTFPNYLFITNWLGIGTTSPRNTLNVIGTGNFTTDLYVAEQQVCREDGTNCPAGAGETGNVTDVTGSAPITSTGGATPNIALTMLGDLATTSPITGAVNDIFPGATGAKATIAINNASTSQIGAVQLENSTSSTSITTAATPYSVKAAYDLANSKLSAESDTLATVTGRGATTATASSFTSTANPGLTVGDGSTGYLKVGGSTISDAAGDLTLDSDSGEIYIPDNVGIGTTGPGYKLEVLGGIIAGEIARFTAADYNTHSIGFGVDGAGANWGASIFQDGTRRFTVDSTGGILVGANYQTSNAPTNGAIIEGNVGIGTTSPVSKLHIKSGTGNASGQSATYDNVIIEDSDYAYLNLNNPTDTGGAAVWFSDNQYQRGGIYYDFVGDKLSLFSGSADRLTILSGGNVGIGTTAPGQLLHLRDGTVTVGSLRSTLRIDDTTAAAANVGPGIRFVGQFSGGDIDYGGIGAYKTSATTSDTGTYLSFHTVTNPATIPTEKVRITTDGNVGIGTTGPGQKLSIANSNYIGWVNGAGSATWTNLVVATDNQMYIQYPAGAALNIRDTDGNPRIKIDSAGNVGIGTTSPTEKLAVAGNISSTTGAVFATSSGYVGIGTATPTAKLHIKGTSDIATFDDTQIKLYSPVSFENTGDTSIAGDLVLTGASSNTIESYAPLYLKTSPGAAKDIILQPGGGGEVGVQGNLSVTDSIQLSSTGYIHSGGDVIIRLGV